MATDITSYVNKIKNAIYGRDVRSAIVSAITKINDDNNKYDSIKAEVISARDTTVAREPADHRRGEQRPVAYRRGHVEEHDAHGHDQDRHDQDDGAQHRHHQGRDDHTEHRLRREGRAGREDAGQPPSIRWARSTSA